MASALALASNARAEPARASPLEIAVRIESPAACPGETFLAALARRTRRPFEVRPESKVTLLITVATTDAGFEAAAAFAGASGRAERTVRGSCDEISAALALVSAIWLESEPTSPTRTVLPVADAGGGDALEHARDNAPTPRATTSHTWVGAQGFAAFGVFGRPAVGAGLFGTYERERVDARLGLRGALANDAIALGTAHFDWLVVPLDGCLHTRTTVRVSGCARVEPGFLHASFVRSTSLPWLTLGVGPRLDARVGPARLELETFVVATATGYRVSPAGATLVPFRSIATATAIGVALPLP